MSKFFKNKKGVTILEGLVAMGVLAMVAVGVLGVVLSISRKSTQPDIREEMVYAVEQAYHDLQMYTSIPTSISIPKAQWLCQEEDVNYAVHPLEVGSEPHIIDCRLPAICDPNPEKSSFSYTVSSSHFPYGQGNLVPSRDLAHTSSMREFNINFSITCNGFKL